MTTYDWYDIFNLNEFLATGLPSRTIKVLLVGIGLKTIQIVRGVGVSIVYEGVMLRIGLNDKNPFEFGGYAVALETDGNVAFGVAREN
jgi:hypothetical protein